MTQGFYGDSTEGGEPAPAVPGSFGPLSFEEWLTQYFPTLSPTEGGAFGTQPAWYASALAMYQSWLETGEVGTIDNPGGTPIPPTSPTDPEDPDAPPSWEDSTETQKALLDTLLGVFTAAGISGVDATALTEMVKGWLLENKGEQEILSLWEQSEIYQKYFPENALRIANGYGKLTEAEIIRLREDYRTQAKFILGFDMDPQGLANLIGNDVSIEEFATNLGTYKKVREWGGAIQELFENAYGFQLDDESLQDLLNNTVSTPELDEFYRDAFFRGYGTKFGLDALDQDVADKLKELGVSEQAFTQGIKNVADLQAAYSKMSSIDASLAGQTGNEFFNDTPLNELIKGILYEDPATKRKIQNTLAREAARFAGQGGVATQGTLAVGLLSAEERRRMGAR